MTRAALATAIGVASAAALALLLALAAPPPTRDAPPPRRATAFEAARKEPNASPPPRARRATEPSRPIDFPRPRTERRRAPEAAHAPNVDAFATAVSTPIPPWRAAEPKIPSRPVAAPPSGAVSRTEAPKPSAETPEEAAAPADAGRAPGERGPVGTLRAARDVRTPRPSYPAAARDAGEEGEVVVRISIDVAGRVGGVEVVSGVASDRLRRVVLETVSRWTFEPATRDGKPEPSSTTRRFVFRLEER